MFSIIFIAFDPEEYQRALAQGVVRSAYARVMFVGPGGVGKSSLLHGLMNKPLPKANSTQLAETVTVKPATKKWASAGENSKSFWREITDSDEIMELVGLILLVAKVTAGRSDSSRFVSQEVAAIKIFSTRLDSVEITNNQQKTSADVLSIQQKIVNDILTQIAEIAKKNPNAQAPEKEVLLLLWDCGGQSIFLDILPAFLTPRTMFFLFYDARRIVDSCVIRSFHNGKMIDFQEQSVTTVEMLLEWMASIHAMLVPINPEEAEESVPKFPRIIPIGTHGDDSDVNKEEVIHQLNVECEGKAFIPFLKKSMIVDNTTAGQGENEDPAFRSIRKEVYDFACKDLVVETPVAWVLFRRVFQKVTKELNSPIVPYQTAEEIAVACNIPPTAISTVVRFYHDLAVFFHYNKVPSLQDRIIADPQWLIRQFAKIMAPKGFAKLWKAPQFLDDEVWKGHELLWAQLWESGVLVQSLYEEVWKDCELPPQSLIDLLVHFLLAAPIRKESRVTNLQGKEYFISSVLPTFKSNIRTVKCLTIKHTAPLHLTFNTHYVPPGFFCRLVTTLLNTSRFQVFFPEGVYRDRIIMLYGEKNQEIDKVILEKHKSSIQVEVVRTQDRHKGGTPFSITCREVLNIINNCFPTILHWLKGINIKYAFICEHCPKSNKQHFIHISLDSPTVFCKGMRCDNQEFVILTTSHKYWLKICNDQYMTTLDPTSMNLGVELQKIGTEVQQRGKIKELADTLEMGYCVRALANDPDEAITMLQNWSGEIKGDECPNIRLHLAYHLESIGMDDIVYRHQMCQIPITPRHQLNLDQVLDSGNRDVSKHLGRIADSMCEWEGRVAEVLELSSADVENIKEKHKQKFNLQKREALQVWKQKLGYKATYRNLITAFENAGHKDYAKSVYDCLGIQHPSGSQWVTSQFSPQQQLEVFTKTQQQVVQQQFSGPGVQRPQQQYARWQEPQQQFTRGQQPQHLFTVPEAQQPQPEQSIRTLQPQNMTQQPEKSSEKGVPQLHVQCTQSNNPTNDGAYYSGSVAGGTTQQLHYSTKIPSASTTQVSQTDWDVYQPKSQSAQRSQLPHCSWNLSAYSVPVSGTGHSVSSQGPASQSQGTEVRWLHQFASGSNSNSTGDSSQAGWAALKELDTSRRHERVTCNTSQQNLYPFTPGSSTNPYL